MRVFMTSIAGNTCTVNTNAFGNLYRCVLLLYVIWIRETHCGDTQNAMLYIGFPFEKDNNRLRGVTNSG